MAETVCFIIMLAYNQKMLIITVKNLIVKINTISFTIFSLLVAVAGFEALIIGLCVGCFTTEL